MKTTRVITILYVVGVLLVICGALFAGCFNAIFDQLLKKMLTIKRDADIYSKWEHSSVPIYMRYYFFNVTNPDDVQYEGAKPILVEMGPYTYLKRSKREAVEFDTKAGTVSYNSNETFYFQRDMSVGGEDEIITTLNPVLVVLGNKMDNAKSMFASLGYLVLFPFDLTEIFISRSVGELLYKGYHDPLIKFMGQITGKAKYQEGKFGFLYQKNGTDSGRFEINSGSNGMDDYQYIQKYENKSALTFWKDPYCNMINGTDGKQFPPHVSKEKTIRIFISNLCRSLYADFEKETDVKGLKTYKFAVPERFFVIEPHHKCFCSDEFTCRDGMFSLAPCKDGAPILISAPHFYQGNKRDQTNVIGLNPSKESHETFLEIEPVTGVVSRAAKRIQMNLPLRKYNSLSAFQDVPELIMPILWVDETASLPQASADKLHKTTATSFKFVYSICGALVICGLILIAVGICKKRNIPKDKLGEYTLKK